METREPFARETTAGGRSYETHLGGRERAAPVTFVLGLPSQIVGENGQTGGGGGLFSTPGAVPASGFRVAVGDEWGNEGRGSLGQAGWQTSFAPRFPFV